MAYIDVATLASVVQVNETSRATDLQRVIDAAAGEIDAEIGYTLGVSDDAWKLALAAHVNLERAADLWHMELVPVGIMGLGGESPLFTPRNSWERHANVLTPLKNEWGIG
jgi:hypothetical protein